MCQKTGCRQTKNGAHCWSPTSVLSIDLLIVDGNLDYIMTTPRSDKRNQEVPSNKIPELSDEDGTMSYVARDAIYSTNSSLNEPEMFGKIYTMANSLIEVSTEIGHGKSARIGFDTDLSQDDFYNSELSLRYERRYRRYVMLPCQRVSQSVRSIRICRRYYEVWIIDTIFVEVFWRRYSSE